jgi:hypothetical protein
VHDGKDHIHFDGLDATSDKAFLNLSTVIFCVSYTLWVQVLATLRPSLGYTVTF